MASLQEQLLKAGLTTKDKANKAKGEKRKQNKLKRKQKDSSLDQSKLAAQQALEQQAQRARELNQEKNAQAEQKAIVAQIKQLIESNQQPLGEPVISFNFSDQGAIKKIEVSNLVHKHLTQGQLAIAKHLQGYALVPKVIAEKIQQRSNDFIISLNESTLEPAEDDPYAEYQIPDDLMW
ncbi:DUF2058 domain-containing protein [Aliikangiella sp. IMCC44653]